MSVEWQNLSKNKMAIALWEGIGPSEDGVPLDAGASSSVAGCIQFSGTFGAGTVSFQHSNDGVTWYSVADLLGTTIDATAVGIYNFSTAARYLRVLADANVTNVDALLVLRG